MSEVVKGILRAVSSGLQIPTIIILILLILLTILMLGSFFAELFTERKNLKLNIPKLVDQLQGKTTAEMKDVVEKSTLLTRQKNAAQELISRVTYPDDTREALARQLIADEEMRYGKIVKITDLTARVAPMFGLMGTLIPLGPGLIALGQGDTKTLSDSLLIAFDTTVAGLISGAISYVISGLRKGWYEQYMIGLETIMETILDVQSTERRKAAQQMKQKAAPAPKAQTAPAPAAQARPAAPAARSQAAPAAPASIAQAAPAASAPVAPASIGSAAAPAAAATVQAKAAQAEDEIEQLFAETLNPAMAEAAHVNVMPTIEEATRETITGPTSSRLQEEVRAAEEAIRRAEARASSKLDETQVHDILESFGSEDGRL